MSLCCARLGESEPAAIAIDNASVALHPVIKFSRRILPALEGFPTHGPSTAYSELRIRRYILLYSQVIQQIEVGIQIVIFFQRLQIANRRAGLL